MASTNGQIEELKTLSDSHGGIDSEQFKTFVNTTGGE
jgi:hypothetical protein